MFLPWMMALFRANNNVKGQIFNYDATLQPFSSSLFPFFFAFSHK